MTTRRGRTRARSGRCRPHRLSDVRVWLASLQPLRQAASATWVLAARTAAAAFAGGGDEGLRAKRPKRLA